MGGYLLETSSIKNITPIFDRGIYIFLMDSLRSKVYVYIYDIY